MSSISPSQRYHELLSKLVLQRSVKKLAGMVLSQDEEAYFAGELDLCWREMDDHERNKIVVLIAASQI